MIKKSKLLIYILLIYIYEPFIWNILSHTLNIFPIIEYIFFLFMLCLIIVITSKLNKQVFYFSVIFSLFLFINWMSVDYKYYMFVEGSQAILKTLIPCYCLINKNMNINKFINTWYRFALKNYIFLFVLIFLYKFNLVPYAVFANFCIPNVFIITYKIMESNKKIYKDVFIILISILITGLFGGRTATFIMSLMLIFSILFNKNISKNKKIFFVIILVTVTFIVLNYITVILLYLKNLMEFFKLKIRTINLLIETLKTKKIYFTGRDYIYTQCIEYIKDRYFFPSGFGVVLNLTDGKYYYSHNIILQILITFGVPVTILLSFITIFRIKIIKNYPEYIKRLLKYMFSVYFIIGIFGSSFWIHFLSTMFIALFFFKNNFLIKRK